MYVKIANVSGPVNRLYLEKLGISTKRDSDLTIGQFGSGAKFAPIAALRKGWEWVSVGYDDFGDYQMRFDVRETAGINEVIFVYDDNTIRDSSYTLEAGSLSWEDDFQIIREALANAIDAHIESGDGWSWELVDHIENSRDEFAVYITDTNTGEAPGEIVEILENIDYWFSIDRTEVVGNNHGKVFRKVMDDDSGEIKIFHRGVRVHEMEISEDDDHVFDYQLDGVTLNEERRVRDSYDINRYIMDMFSAFDENDYGVIRILLSKPDRSYEFNHASIYQVQYLDWDEIWAEIWHSVHGKKAIPVKDGSDGFIISRLETKGFKPIPVSRVLVSILNIAGVKSIEDILGEAFDIDTVELHDSQSEVFDMAVKMCNNSGFDINGGEFKFYTDDSYHAPLGRSVGNERFINVSIVNHERMETLIGTMIHENDHCVSGYTDADERFRGIADDHIGRLIMDRN
jgi:hypothetical protein